MFKRTSTLAAAAVAAGALAVAPAAAQAMTLRLGDLQLTAKMAITVPVAVSCSPFDPELVPLRSGMSVSVQQAVGKDIAYGSGIAGGYVYGDLRFTCDGSEQTVPVTVLASTSGAPFHGGKVVVTAYGYASAGVPCYPGATNCFTETSSQSASIGPVAAKL